MDYTVSKLMKRRHPSKLTRRTSPGKGEPAAPRLDRSRAISGWAVLLAVGLIVLATATAFSNSFAGAFVFDDNLAIPENPTISRLWPLSKLLCPPTSAATVAGRPLLNVSLAINHLISGYNVWSYHAANLLIHVLAALLLLGILRRTLLLPTMRESWGTAALPIGFAVALLWAVHPLQTESVTYIVQRAESLMGLLYLLTLYCFLRGATSGSPLPLGEGPGVRAAEDTSPDTLAVLHDRPHPSPLPKGEGTPWYAASVLACLLGMATKEVMVSAPLIVFLYDRTFCAGSFREAWRWRYPYYLALASTWLLLAWLVLSTGNLDSARFCHAEHHVVGVPGNAGRRDRPLPSAVAMARRLVPGLRMARGAVDQ